MQSSALSLQGVVTIEVVTPEGETIYKASKNNTLVKEAAKILLGNILPYISGVSDSRSFSNTANDGRPTISAGEGGPNNLLAVSYVALGYYLDGESDPGLSAVAASDLTMQVASSRLVYKALTDFTLGQYSVSYIASFTVDQSTEDRNYVEAALMCPVGAAIGHYFAIPDPDGGQFDSTDLVMFAHQIHSPVQASEGNTIKYTWTISMQEPS